MRKLQTLGFLAILAVSAGCDSDVAAPEFSVEFVSPAPGEVVTLGEPLQLRIDLVSALDVRDADILFTPAAPGSNGFVAEAIPIRQVNGLRHFRIDTTLTIPFVDTEATKGRLFLVTPAGTYNRMGSVQVNVR